MGNDPPQNGGNGYVKAAAWGALAIGVVSAIISIYRDLTTVQAELRAFKEATIERREYQSREFERLENTITERIRREEDRNNRIERELGEATAVDKLFVAGKLNLIGK